MKRFFLLMLSAMLFAGSLYGRITDDHLTGNDIEDKMLSLVNPEKIQTKAEQTIHTSSGQTRTFVYESFSEGGGEKNLIRYIEPKRIKGQAFLMLNYADDIWAYFPRTGRTRKLPTHAKKQKLMGSDFTYEDLGSGDSWREDYDVKREKDTQWEGEESFSLLFDAKENAGATYPRMRVIVRKKDYSPLVIKYYDDNENLVKTLFMRDIREVEGIPTAMTMEMVSEKDGSSTVIRNLSVTYNVTFPENFFTARNLSR